MSNLSVRGVDDTAVARLKEQAKSRGISLNAYLVELIQSNAGIRAKLNTGISMISPEPGHPKTFKNSKKVSAISDKSTRNYGGDTCFP